MGSRRQDGTRAMSLRLPEGLAREVEEIAAWRGGMPMAAYIREAVSEQVRRDRRRQQAAEAAGR